MLTMKELDKKLADYGVYGRSNLRADVLDVFKNGREIEQLFRNPGIYKDGGEFKAKIQRLIEVYYLNTVKEDNVELQNLLINLLYKFYETIDSLILQEGIIFGVERYGGETVDQAKYDMLRHFYFLNARFFDINYDEANFLYRVNNQKRILRFFLSYDIQINQKLISDIQNQILKNTYLETIGDVPEDYLNFKENVLSEKQKKLLLIALKNYFSDHYFIQNIYDMGLPEQIGYMYIRKSMNKKRLYEKLVMNETLAVEYRLYALLRSSSIESNPFGIAYSIKHEFDIAKNTESSLREGADAILNNALKRELSTGDNYLDSLEAEMLFTAAAVSLHEKYPDVNLVEFLGQLKYTFVRDSNTEFIVKYTESDDSEYVRIAMNQDYINSIKDFVESLYKINKGDKTEIKNKNIKTVAKGPLALIRIVRNPK